MAKNKGGKNTEKAAGNGRLKKAAGIAATIIVVVGVASVAYFARQPQKPVSPEPTSKRGSVPAAAEAKVPSVLVVDAGGPRLVGLASGRVTELSWPDDVARLGQPLSQVQGADGRSGEPVWLESGFVRTSSTSVRAADGRRTAWLGLDKRDGGSTVLVQLGRESGSYALRSRNGKKISGVQLIGWTNSQELAFAGSATGTRWLYLLDMDGSVAPLALLPDQAWLFRVADGAIYYATAEPGEGLESPQAAPSAIWRVGLAGKSEKIADEPSAVIQAFTAADGRLAYALEDGTLKFVRDGLAHDIGKQGVPIMDLGTEGVLVRKDDGLYAVSDNGSARKIPSASLDSSVYYLGQANANSSSTSVVK